MKKPDLKKISFSAVLILFLTAGVVAACIPGGAENVWHGVFSFFGLRDFSSCAESAPMAVHVLDVGKADSIFIECGGKFMLVDGGTADRGRDVAAYLKKFGVKTLDYVVNTHPDDDHIGGLKDVLQGFGIEHYLAPDIPSKLIPKTEEYRDVQDALQQKGLKTIHPKAGSFFSVAGLKAEILGPVFPGNSTNNNSIILKLTFGRTRFLLTGDAETEEEQTLISSGRDLSADVLKVGHHGSATATSQVFLDAVKPKFAAISVGYDSNKLPKRTVLKRLADAGVTVYRTDVSGTLIFLSDGSKIAVRTEK